MLRFLILAGAGLMAVVVLVSIATAVPIGLFINV
jgi:hypothetical protein